MRSILLCLLGILLVGAHDLDSQVLDMVSDFPSKFLSNTSHTEGILDLMKGHFDISLEYLFASKFFGSQYNERPGMAKLLSEESDRHWEEGMNVLKEYLHLGGTTHQQIFLDKMNYAKLNTFFAGYESSQEKYMGSFKRVMERSRTMGDIISDLHHVANHRTSAHGDANVAHFLEEKAEKEFAVARKMVGHFMTVQKMKKFGIALDIFDKNL